jgi:hypothetical protein
MEKEWCVRKDEAFSPNTGSNILINGLESWFSR